MQARQLEVFCMLMRCGTVTGAAAMLNISQPALSQILLHAEDQLGFKLFDRVAARRGGRLRHPHPVGVEVQRVEPGRVQLRHQ